jgi:hypothetical protein
VFFADFRFTILRIGANVLGFVLFALASGMNDIETRTTVQDIAATLAVFGSTCCFAFLTQSHESYASMLRKQPELMNLLRTSTAPENTNIGIKREMINAYLITF